MFKKILLGTSLICAATIANAATITFTESTELASDPLSATNWNKTLALPDFDISLGTLTGVQINYFAGIQGEAKVESLDASPANIEISLAAELDFSLGGDTRKVLIPTISESTTLSPFDGIIDFAGMSGNDFGVLAENETENGPLFGSNLGQYMDGIDNVFEISASAASSAIGSGNIVSQFATRATARITMTYTYVPTIVGVSSPSHIALVCIGLIGLIGVRKLLK